MAIMSFTDPLDACFGLLGQRIATRTGVESSSGTIYWADKRLSKAKYALSFCSRHTLKRNFWIFWEMSFVSWCLRLFQNTMYHFAIVWNLIRDFDSLNFFIFIFIFFCHNMLTSNRQLMNRNWLCHIFWNNILQKAILRSSTTGPATGVNWTNWSTAGNIICTMPTTLDGWCRPYSPTNTTQFLSRVPLPVSHDTAGLRSYQYVKRNLLSLSLKILGEGGWGQYIFQGVNLKVIKFDHFVEQRVVFSLVLCFVFGRKKKNRQMRPPPPPQARLLARPVYC